MKQILLLEPDDFTRLKAGETIELRPGLLLAAASKGKPASRSAAPAAAGHECATCGRSFGTAVGLRTHQGRSHRKGVKP